MERDPICGQEEHTHTDECYEHRLICGKTEQDGQAETTQRVLSCAFTTHQHTENCYNADGQLVCGYADYAIHTHDENCYDADGNLVCTLPEVKQHGHDGSCYETKTVLACGQDESSVQTIEESSDPFSDGTDVFGSGDNNVYVGDSEGGHIHTEECYETKYTLICGKDEIIPHTHTAECYDENGNLVCGRLEIQEHQHDENCFMTVTTEAVEGHTHTDECYEDVLICDKAEHVHTEECYPQEEAEDEVSEGDAEAADEAVAEETGEEVAGEEATAEEDAQEDVDTVEDAEVSEEEADTAEETEAAEEEEDSDLVAMEPAVEYICGKEEHTHGEGCWDEEGNLICGMEEHVHDETCLPEADDEEAEEEPVVAKILTVEGSDYTVEVTYTDEAQIPDNAVLSVREIEQGTEEYESYYQQAVEAVQGGDTSSLAFARFFDISFVVDGTEIEPAAEVAVKISYKDAVEVPEGSEVKSVHFGEETEVLDVQTNGADGTVEEVAFDANGFSVYGIVGTEAITADIITAAGQTYTVTVSYTEEAKIPADAKLKLSEVAEGNEDYQKALEAIIAEAEKEFVEAADSDSEPEAFDADSYKESLGLDVLDISIVDKEGNEVEPSAPVKVTIERKNLPDDIDAEAFENIAEIQHLNESTETPFLETVVTAGSETTGDITVTDGAVKAEFETGSFSLYTVKWSKSSITVHFVDRDGNELTGITDENGNSVDGSSITISKSGSLDLSTYKKDGYTYANTRITGYGDTGLIIYPKFEANSKGSKLRYWGDGTNAPSDDSDRKEFQNGKNVYVIMDPVPSTSGSGSGSGGGSTIADLPDPETSKTLTNNHDGTYDLNLSITGKSASKKENKNINVLFVIDNSSSMGSGTGSRLENTKDAVKESAKALLDNNTTAFPKLVEVAAVSFDGTADDVVGWTNVQSTFDTEIGNISKGWGTNWEDGLKKALDYGTGDGDPTYVIFFTDGMPYGYRGNDNTYKESSNRPAMMAAKDEARAIVNSGRTLYNIFAYGSDSDYKADYLGQLTDYAYNDNSKRDTYYKKAAEKDDVVKALAEIVDSITQKAGFEKVKITDGITGLTQSTVIHGQANAFTYYRSGGKNANGTEKYDSTANKGKGEKWTEAPTASYSATTGVTWDLASIGQLEDGVTYTVSFTVWPGQGAYDAVAKINNTADPKAAYDALDPTVKAQILFDEETGTCSLKTNTEAKAEYTTVKTSTEKKLPSGAIQDGNTWKYKDPSGNEWTYVQNVDETYTGTTTKDKTLTYKEIPSIPLAKTTMKVRKIWVDELTSAADRPESIKFTIYEDNVEYKTVTLSGTGNVWEAEINIAPGIYVTPGTHGTASSGDSPGVLEGSEGHVYTILETSTENHYDFSTSPVKPMLNGTTTTDGDMIEYLTKTAWSSSEAALTATNTVKDGIYIYKKVTTDGTHEIDCDEQFTFKVTLKDAEDKPVYTSGQGASGDLAWIIDKEDTSSPDGYAEVQRDYYTSTDGTVTLTMGASGRIRIVNVPVGTTFTVEEVTEEGTMPAGYEYYNSKVNSQAATTDNRATGITVGNTQWATTITNKRNALSVDLLKVDNTDSSKTLEGAEFTLYKKDGTTPATDANGNSIGTIRSGTDGKASIGTLLAGNYVLKETKAPAGYNLMTSNVTIIVAAENVTAMQGKSQCAVVKSENGLSYTIKVTNSAGVELPNTGGSGTLPYTLGGIALIMASALMYGFVSRRRRERRLR